MNFVEQVEKLPENIKKFLTSNEPRLELEKICFLYGIQAENIQNISGPIGLIFVSNLKLENLPKIIIDNLHTEEKIAFSLAYEINKRIFNRFPDYFKDSNGLLEQWVAQKSAPLISEDEAQKKVLEIEPWILEEENEKNKLIRNEEREQEKFKSSLENLPIQDALKKFPALGEQLITGSHIKLKSFPDPVRPSIKNWLSDYTFTSGYNTHNSMDRGTYLFQNENTKKLNSLDRQKLGYILKAYDENSPISVNMTLKQVIFPKAEAPRIAASRPEMPPKQAYLPPKDIFEKEKEISLKAAEAAKQHINQTPKISSLTSKIDGGKIDFSSPHKFPYEKQEEKTDHNTHTPQPIIITPRGFKRDLDQDSNPNLNVPPRNVVNLKE